MAFRFKEVQAKRDTKSKDKLGLCICIHGCWMAIDRLQDRGGGMDQILVNAMVRLPLLGNTTFSLVKCDLLLFPNCLTRVLPTSVKF